MRKLTKNQGNIILLAITVVWGSGFVITKLVLSAGIPAGLLTAFRGAGLMLLSFLFFHKKIIKSKKKDVLVGLVAGITNAIAFIFQTVGLVFTTPTISGFLTIMHILFVPVIAMIFYRKKLAPQMYPAIIIAFIGTLVITNVSFSSFRMGIGEWLSLAGALSFAISIAFIGNSAVDTPPEVIGFWMGVCQFAVSFAYFLIADKGVVGEVDWRIVILPILYLSLIGTFAATNGQVLAQKSVDETTAAIIMSMEAVFGAVISLIFGYDVFSVRLLAGGLLIFAGVLVAIVNFRKLFKIKLK
ncbi:MAG: DMT family transporter [Clostridia bacterium]